jgi:Holliday junction resolvasome RuvABC ATP-dependent DNA helicase subunit
MEWKVIKVLNPIIEQFKISGKKIKPFIFAGATINKHELIKNNPDTLDRIPTHIKFERYNAKEIAQIIAQYHKQLYPQVIVSQEVINTISINAKFNPRTSIALLEEFVVENNIKTVLHNCNIIKNGLTKIDIRILEILEQSGKRMGANALAMKAKLSQNEYVREYEPFLVEYDYINRIPSRIITEKGKELLKEVKNEK